MINRVIHLCKDDENVTLTAVVSETKREKRDAILVIPGGAYNMVAADREGEPIAMTFASKGYACFVLNYSIKEKAKFPRPLLEASMAMVYIREHAEEYGIDPERIFVCGFSAGGHLAAALGTRWHTKEVNEALDIPFGANRPCGMLLCYPVLVLQKKTHRGTFLNVFGTETPTAEQIEFCSFERGLGEYTPPAFLVHTANDTVVPVENTLVMANALSEAKIPFEVHIYPDGPHGLALANNVTATGPDMLREDFAAWPELADVWMQKKCK